MELDAFDGSSRRRTPMTSPSSVRAVISRSSGTRIAASEWYRPASISSGEPGVYPTSVVADAACLPGAVAAPLPARPRRRTPRRSPDGRGRRRAWGRAARVAGSPRRRPRRRTDGPVRETTRRSAPRASASSSSDCVVAEHLDVGSELLEQVDEVPGEGVVVVDHQKLHAYSSSASSIAASSAASFARHSRCSAAGSESATTPAPAWSRATPSATTIVLSAMQVSIVPSGRT